MNDKTQNRYTCDKCNEPCESITIFDNGKAYCDRCTKEIKEAKKTLPYSAHNSGGQRLGEKADGDAIITNEVIKVFSEMGIAFDIYNNSPFEDDGEKWTLNKIKDRVKKLTEARILSGIIYQIGNYPNEDFFRVYAITNGIA